MESTMKDKPEENFLKIDTVWSEAEENFENIAVKEEIISDAEPETIFPSENANKDIESCNNLKISKIKEKCAINSNDLWQPLNKKIKCKRPRSVNEETEITENLKSSCLHDTKNFKIIKKRLRCGECRSLVCPECCKIMIGSLQNHFLGSDINICDSYPCKLCCMVFHSLCSLQAHIRIHSMETPYICPDCGLIYNNIYFLILHLINKCYHVYKIVQYKCKSCPGSYFSVDMFVQHIQAQHLNSVFRCSYCSSLFNDSDEFNSHMDHIHQKQKVQHLDYFRCTLCSNMVIPKFMYQRHVDQHCNNSESYEIDYHCLCGDLFSSMGAFRAHIQMCGKKGILPPQWAFLQKKLKTQENTLIENVQSKDDVVVQGVQNYSSVGIDVHSVKLNFSNSSSKNNPTVEMGKYEETVDIGNTASKENFCSKSVDKDAINKCNFFFNDKIRDPCKDPSSKTDASLSEESTTSTSNNLKDNAKFINGSLGSLCNVNLTETALPMKTFITENVARGKAEHLAFGSANSTPNILTGNGQNNLTPRVCESDGFEENQTNKSDKEIEQNDCDVSKIFFHHIPCDHLGYVKTQCTESTKKGTPLGENTLLCKRVYHDTLKDYHIVTELDEKTGLITSKKVPTENLEEDELESKEDACEEENDNVSSCNLLTPKIYCNDKIKLKLGSSFFTCPFCIVLFPKHNLTLQQFRLHLECYHPDAALNITVNRNETEKIDKNSPSSEKNRRGLEDFENIESQTKLQTIADVGSNNNTQQYSSKGNSLKNQSEFNSQKILNENQSKLEEINCALVESGNGVDSSFGNFQNESTVGGEIKVSKEKEGTSNKKEFSGEDEKENFTKKSGRLLNFSQNKENDVFCTVKVSLRDGNASNEGNNIPVCEVNDEKTDGSETVVKSLSKNYAGGDVSGEKEENSKLGRTSFKKSENSHKAESSRESKKITNKEQKTSARSEGSGTEGLNDCNVPDEEHDLMDLKKNVGKNENYDKIVFSKKDGKKPDGKGKKQLSCSKSSDFGDEFENSKDSNWSALSDVEMMAGRDSRTADSIEESSIRHAGAEKEKLRRESEVWSEFYESLKIAENLKKNEKRKPILDGEKKSLVLTDYSAKRVVKKPKRYRESSESDDSGAAYENSDSDGDLVLPNELVNDFCEEKTSQINDGSLSEIRVHKKQKLLNKLQNVDPRFVDYLFELINKKEKCFELYKKHSSLRVSRYSQDLRSYRKKVLNGIKHRGRPHKLLRYQELVKKRDPTQGMSPGEVIRKEIGYQGPQKKNLDLSNDKFNEKKRGRPRKMVESGRLKERRRSDKEVDFIEKNFEREENDLSPSKRKRKLSSKLQYYKKINVSDDKDDFSSGQVITTKTADSGKKFSCAVCKETFPEPTEFRDHIVVHRVEENTYQCMECGECFVVRPSLEKHLHAFHKIKNTDKYITENQCFNIKKEASETEVEPLKENQCKVCKDQFDRPIDLTKHFRIHGMAFLREFKKDGKTKC